MPKEMIYLKSEEGDDFDDIDEDGEDTDSDSEEDTDEDSYDGD